MCTCKILNGGTTTKCSRIPWQRSVMCFYVILALMKIASCEAIPSIKEFFPSIKNDLTKVTWYHDVYNDHAFKGAIEVKAMMFNSDVTLKMTKRPGLGKKAVYSPTMCSKKYRNFGMSLKEFLKKAADAKSFGAKLDFLKIDAFRDSIKDLQAMSGELKFPLWLHADTDNMGEKDIDKFLSLCTHNFPEATISIGMLHKGQKFVSKREYTAKLVTQMKDTLTRNNVTQTVVFPVDLVGATYSVDTLSALNDVHGITDSALYMYAGVGSHLSEDEISRAWKLIKIFGRDRVYLDTEGYLHDQLFKTL